MQPDLLTQLIAHWPDELSGLCHLELALSGGLDSCVLLHLLCRWRDEAGGPALSAVHVHHGISRHADDWAAFCGQLCVQHAVPLRVEHVSLQRQGGQSLEAVARQARYRAFAASPAKVIALAQHADDQAETALLQLLRGGGPRALAGMPRCRTWQGKQLWRPLLTVGRSVLRQYAEEHGLQWVEDDSNADAANYLRNYLRLNTLPALRQRVPQLDTHLLRSTRRMADAASILDDMAALDWQQVGGPEGLSVPLLLQLSLPRQRNLVLYWLAQQATSLPAPEALDALLAALAAGQAARLALSDAELFSYRQALSLVRVVASAPPWPQQCRVGEVWQGEHGMLQWQRGFGLPADWQGAALSLCARQPGAMLPVAVGRKPLKKLFQEHSIPALLRNDWPVLQGADGALLGVPSVALDVQLCQPGGWWPLWIPNAIRR